jgi:hypothetical protein
MEWMPCSSAPCWEKPRQTQATLPSRSQLEEIAHGIATQTDEMPSGAEQSRLLDAAAGMTRYEAESAFSLSLVRHGHLLVETLWELKSQVLKKSGLLQLHRGGDTFAELGDLDAQSVLQAGTAPSHRA